jgi:hypothetical protein
MHTSSPFFGLDTEPAPGSLVKPIPGGPDSASYRDDYAYHSLGHGTDSAIQQSESRWEPSHKVLRYDGCFD